MLVYYGKAGWYANIALTVTYFSCLEILAKQIAALTLPGIAGMFNNQPRNW
jgi:SecD/SecF fusion protein